MMQPLRLRNIYIYIFFSFIRAEIICFPVHRAASSLFSQLLVHKIAKKKKKQITITRAQVDFNLTSWNQQMFNVFG